MSDHPFQTLAFSEIKEKLPKDCWAYSRNARRGEFENETALRHAGDLRLSELDLDFPIRASDGAAPQVFMILVEGSLQVDGPIANLETDGAVGLVVLGNLAVRDMVVGGQQVYVAGNLQVQGLFWGDYNHGQLTVKGEAAVPLFIDTEEYHVDIAGSCDFTRRISCWDDDGEEQDLSGEELKAIFVPECLVDVDEDPGLWRERIVEHLRADAPVFRPERLPAPPTPPIVFAFPDRIISPQNLALALSPALLAAKPTEGGTHRYEFWIGDTFCRVGWFPGAEPNGGFKSIYLQGDDYAVTLRLAPVEEKLDLIARLAGARPRHTWKLSFRMRAMADASEDPWTEYQETLPEPARPFCESAWGTLLEGLSSYAYARDLVSPEAVRGILALPLAAPYDDYYDDEKNGFWAKNLYCSFRQEGALHKDAPQPPLVKIARDHTGPDGVQKREFFVFEVHKHLDGSEAVLIRYTPDEDKSSTQQSYRGNAELLQRAARTFRRAEERLHKYNRMLLEGEVPIREEDFAIRYWREKGYITEA